MTDFNRITEADLARPWTAGDEMHYRNTRAELREQGRYAVMYSRRLRTATDRWHQVNALADWKLTRSRMAFTLEIWKMLRIRRRATQRMHEMIAGEG